MAALEEFKLINSQSLSLEKEIGKRNGEIKLVRYFKQRGVLFLGYEKEALVALKINNIN